MLRALGYDIYRIEGPRLASPRTVHEQRFEYQSKFVEFDIHSGSRVLDIGSGGDPFPYATVLADRYLETSRHRWAQFKSEDKPVVVCDIKYLPFKDKAFDYVYCSHVLEHVDDPIKAVREVQRVGQRGYIETPHFMSDALFAWAEGMHKWFVQSIAQRLIFFEYDQRRARGIKSNHWRNTIFGDHYHPLQDVFVDNVDIFVTMLPWEGSVSVTVYYCDGTVRSSENENTDSSLISRGCF